MELKKHNVLLFTRTMKLGGTENVVLQLCQILKPEVRNIIVCSCGGINVEKLLELGVTHYEIADIEKKSPKVIFDVLKKVNDIIKNEEITIIHTHHRMAAFYTRILSFVHKFYFINTSHNTFNDKEFFTRFAYKKANLIACGEMVKKNLVEQYNLPSNQVTVIHNAIEKFEGKIQIIDELKNLKDDGFILVGNIGRLSEQKGMKYFLQSFPKVKQKLNNIKYIIIGEGEDRKKLEQMCVNLEIENDVIFLGYRNDIQNLMTQLDFIVLSSLWEGFPLTPIEAFSVGKTVIGTAVDGTVEIIENNKNGFLIEAKNSNEISDCVIKLAEDVQLRNKFEKNAVECYNLKLGFDVFAENIIKYYQKVTERN